MIKLFYDLETTGLDKDKHAIHDLSGLIEIDDRIVDTFQFRLKPHKGAMISPDALKVGNVSIDDLKAFESPRMVFSKFRSIMDSYVDRFDKNDKIYLVGYNSVRFDDDFLREFFVRNGDQYFGSYFWATGLDVRVLAGEYLQDRRTSMPNFKLGTVAQELGIEIDESRLHGAEYDLEITRMIYRIVTGREIEI